VRRTLAIAVLVLSVSPVLASGAVPTGGVRGTVKQHAGGTCLADDPCDGIGRNVLLSFSRAGYRTRQVRSNAEGAFRIFLAPGRYRVGNAADPATPVTPAVVRVPATGFARVTLVVGSADHRVSAPAP
jgi:hypothetical protein